MVLDINARRYRPVLAQGLGSLHHLVPRHDDPVVATDEVSLGAIDDRPHAFLERAVLNGDTVETRIGQAIFCALRSIR